MNLNICLICREDTCKNLRWSFYRRNCDARPVYQTFLQNVEEFRNLEALPVVLNFGPEFAADFFLDKRANWHYSCHQKFTVWRLHQAKDRKQSKIQMMEIQDTRNVNLLRLTWLCVYFVENKIQKNFMNTPLECGSFLKNNGQ